MAHTTSNTTQVIPAWVAPESPPAGTPEWLPEGAVVYGDFANGNYWSDEAEAAAAAILTDDTVNTNGWWGPTDFDAENIGADGYELTTQPDLALNGAAKAQMLAGGTIVIRYLKPGTAADTIFSIVNTAGTAAIQVESNGQRDVSGFSFVDPDEGDFSLAFTDVLNHGTPTSANAVAITVTPTKFSISINGGAADVSVLTSADYPAEGFDAVVIALRGTVQSILVLEPVADAALPALSAL